MYNLKKNKDTGGIPDTQKNKKIKYNIAFFLEILDNTLVLKQKKKFKKKNKLTVYIVNKKIKKILNKYQF